MDFGWAPWKTQNTATFFSESKELSLRRMLEREETIKATASNVTSQISSFRDDTSQKCCLLDSPVDREANRSILQPVIYRYKNWFIDAVSLCKYEWGRRGRCQWSSFRSRNWPTFLSYVLSLLTKTTDYVLGFYQGKFAGSLLVKYCWLIFSKFYKSRN